MTDEDEDYTPRRWFAHPVELTWDGSEAAEREFARDAAALVHAAEAQLPESAACPACIARGGPMEWRQLRGTYDDVRRWKSFWAFEWSDIALLDGARGGQPDDGFFLMPQFYWLVASRPCPACKGKTSAWAIDPRYEPVVSPSVFEEIMTQPAEPAWPARKMLFTSHEQAEKMRAELGPTVNVVGIRGLPDGMQSVYSFKELCTQEIPFKPAFDLQPPDIRFTVGHRYGGHSRFYGVGYGLGIPEMWIPPCPDAPGVAAMLADGWRWLGWGRFAKDNGTPSRASEKYSSFIDARRVLAGRYADRLPTNRSRKRAKAKARRRARLGAAR